MRLQSSLKNPIAFALVAATVVLAQGCASTASTVMQQGSARGRASSLPALGRDLDIAIEAEDGSGEVVWLSPDRG